jgi:hypothetical protein
VTGGPQEAFRRRESPVKEQREWKGSDVKIRESEGDREASNPENEQAKQKMKE